MTCFVTAACSRVPVVCESVTHAGEHRRPLPDPPPHRRTQLPPVEPGGDQLQLDRGGAGTPLSWLPVATGDPPHGRSPHAPALLRLARRSLQLRRQVIDGVTGRQQGLHPLAAIALSADVVVGQHLQADDLPTVVERHPSTQVVGALTRASSSSGRTEAGRAMSTKYNVGTLPLSASGATKLDDMIFCREFDPGRRSDDRG